MKAGVQSGNAAVSYTHLSQKDILEQLKEIGVSAGMILEVHASLSAFGYVCGGAQTVVNALIEAVGYS